ncbi:response regulator [Caulobacter sp. 17J65-9]|uniref:response regulator n=1 Tax=Caulobacter sp. 17J65-9 TaxID=2709382 RepID=UPI00320476AA
MSPEVLPAKRGRRRAAPTPPPAMDAPLRGRILIVDDDERNAFAAVQALESLGHELVVARSGEEALRRLLHEDFAVILLDLHMPGMDGYETAALIRSRRSSSAIPIVFLTAIFRDEAHVFQAYSAGAVDVVFKPVDPFILRSKVQVLVDLHLKTMEVKRQSDYRQWLLDEHDRVKSEKASAERALRRARERQETILSSLPIIFHSRLPEPPFAPVFVSDGVRAVTGFDAHRFVDEPEFGLSRVHADDRQKVIDALASAVSAGAYECEYRWQCADGSYRVLQDQGVLAPGVEGGHEIFGVMLDVTDRRSLEEQLTQARKMETVGQLTGGVAHDFNNLLTVVLGNVDLLGRREEPDPKRQRQLGAIRHAAERGRSLTRQLLAFSRRQHLNPVNLDVNELIRGFAPLMRQAMGEAVDLTLDLEEGAHCAHVDAAQLETALLNLAVNARDAMDGAGTLAIATETLDAGEARRLRREGAEGAWIRIRVSDTGAGMPPEILERVFEPFFTTKDVGKGSGLGLSQLYGFVSQSGGFVELESAPGRGTTFELLLPATDAPVAERAPAAEAEEAPTGTERVLAVEDDAHVLALAVDLLQGLGYQVATAVNAPAALELMRGGERFDLVFSDVVMPGGASGVQLAYAAREIDPEMKVLLTSGYVGQIELLSDMEFALIDKPYERADLARKLREVLEAPARAEGAPRKAAPRRRAKGGR